MYTFKIESLDELQHQDELLDEVPDELPSGEELDEPEAELELPAIAPPTTVPSTSLPQCPLSAGTTPPTESRQVDLVEGEVCRKFFIDGCGCVESCHMKFEEDYLITTRATTVELSREELDLVVMAQLMANTFSGDATAGAKKRERERESRTTAPIATEE